MPKNLPNHGRFIYFLRAVDTDGKVSVESEGAQNDRATSHLARLEINYTIVAACRTAADEGQE
jgi:hypothetical protein